MKQTQSVNFGPDDLRLFQSHLPASCCLCHCRGVMAAEAVVHLERFTLEARNIRSAALSAHQDSLSLVCVISGVIQFLKKKKKKKKCACSNSADPSSESTEKNQLKHRRDLYRYVFPFLVHQAILRIRLKMFQIRSFFSSSL